MSSTGAMFSLHVLKSQSFKLCRELVESGTAPSCRSRVGQLFVQALSKDPTLKKTAKNYVNAGSNEERATVEGVHGIGAQAGLNYTYLQESCGPFTTIYKSHFD